MAFMNIEIERKFLVNKELWQHLEKPAEEYLVQGYLSIDIYKTIRVRVAGDKAYMTVKGKIDNLSRQEYEFEIPVNMASELIKNFAETVIEKLRYRIKYRGKTWEVDEFEGDNAGLVMAEVELTEEHENIELPEWINKEVSDDFRYYNSNLSKNPYKNWVNDL
jgi:adenylate cyclase